MIRACCADACQAALDRIFDGTVFAHPSTAVGARVPLLMTYPQFVWFILAEEVLTRVHGGPSRPAGQGAAAQH